MAKLSKHFSSGEFACKDGCGLIVVHPLLVERLEILRTMIGRPIPIISGFRCCVHNARVKGATRSRHTVGEAADISQDLHVDLEEATQAGFTGIGTVGRYVTHVDVRPHRGDPVVWRYDA